MSDVPSDPGGDASPEPATDPPAPPTPPPMPAPEDPPPAVEEDPTGVVPLTEPVPLVPPPPGHPWAPAPIMSPTAFPPPPGSGRMTPGPPSHPGTPGATPYAPLDAPPVYAPPAYAPPPPGAFPPGVAPPPAPTADRDKGCLKAALILGAILVVLAIAGVVLVAFVLDDVRDDVFGTDGDAPADSYEVDLTRCSQRADGTPFAELDLTNTSGEQRSFKVQVGFFDRADGGVIGREVYDTTGSIDDAEQTSLRIEGLTEATGDFTCRVTAVSHLGG